MYACLLAPARWLGFFLLCMTIDWLVLPALPACLLAYLASYACLLDSRLLVGWFCLLCMNNYRLVLLALPACWLACLASYACLLTGWFCLPVFLAYFASYACLAPARWLGFFLLCMTIYCFACLACLFDGYLASYACLLAAYWLAGFACLA
jgi:hypothetical protein